MRPMNTSSQDPLTDRQIREIEYHRQRAVKFEEVFLAPMAWDVLENPASSLNRVRTSSYYPQSNGKLER